MVFSFQQYNPQLQDFQRLNIPVFTTNEQRLIYEDRLTLILCELARFKPTIVIANLGPTSFEVMRYLPPGVFRIGTGQSDHPVIYAGLQRYAGCLDCLAVVSQRMQQQAASMPELARSPIVCLPYGVPLPSPMVLPRRDFRGRLRILYFGRLVRPQKRAHLFSQIFEGLKISGIPFHWTVAGEGPERESLERTMAGSATQTLSFPGKVAYADVPRLLSEHDILLLASDHEGLPLSLLEAMGHGLVPVISDLESGVREVVDAGNGMLVPVDDVAGYARAIIHLHEHREELAAKSVAAHDRVKRDFSVEAMADRWLAALPKNCPAVQWPVRWKIQPMLAARHPFYFSPPMRVLRRLAMKFRT